MAVVHAFELMLYFCVIPIVSALFLTALITGPRPPTLDVHAGRAVPAPGAAGRSRWR